MTVPIEVPVRGRFPMLAGQHALPAAVRFLSIQPRAAVDPAERVTAAVASRGFTPRQAQVVGLLALGRSNKAIASELGCAESTVEIHVTAVLRKSGCESRCEFVARFWSEPIDSALPEEPGSLRADALHVA
jgi:DNA-binding NarL/FixJ family response regulator